MKLYLKIINPIISVVVLGCCVWAAITENGLALISNITSGGLSAYFLANGFFSASALFILGKILEEMLITQDKK